VLVDHRQPDGPQAEFPDPRRDLLGRRAPLGRSQAVPPHEPRLPDTREIRNVSAHES